MAETLKRPLSAQDIADEDYDGNDLLDEETSSGWGGSSRSSCESHSTLADAAPAPLSNKSTAAPDEQTSILGTGSSHSLCESQKALAWDSPAPLLDNATPAQDCVIDIPEAEELRNETLPQSSRCGPVAEVLTEDERKKEENGVEVVKARVKAIKDADCGICNSNLTPSDEDNAADLATAYEKQYFHCIKTYKRRSFALLVLVFLYAWLFFLALDFSLNCRKVEIHTEALNATLVVDAGTMNGTPKGTSVMHTDAVVASGLDWRFTLLLSLSASAVLVSWCMAQFEPEVYKIVGLGALQLCILFFNWLGRLFGPNRFGKEAWSEDMSMALSLGAVSWEYGVILCTAVIAIGIHGGKRALIRQFISVAVTVRESYPAAGILVLSLGLLVADLAMLFR